MSTATLDLAQITGTADVVVDGHVLWVRSGVTCSGRYWQFLTRTDVPVGMVVERDGVLVAVFEPVKTIPENPKLPVADAARQFLASLCSAAGGAL